MHKHLLRAHDGSRGSTLLKVVAGSILFERPGSTWLWPAGIRSLSFAPRISVRFAPSYINQNHSARAPEVRHGTIMGEMRKAGRANEKLFPVKTRKPAPYAFVLDALSELPIETRSMFGCLAVYLGDKIVLMLREKQKQLEDNGVWLATTKNHHRLSAVSFRTCVLSSSSGKEVTGWQVLSRPMHRTSNQPPCVPAN